MTVLLLAVVCAVAGATVALLWVVRPLLHRIREGLS